jgi:hypothetical protein
MRDYLEDMAARRAGTTDEVKRNTYKLCPNSHYGKTLENKFGQRNVRLYNSMNDWERNLLRGDVADWTINWAEEDADGNLQSFLGKHYAKKRGGIILNTPRLTGLVVLDYAKAHMYTFHYQVMKQRYGERARLLMTTLTA